MISFKIVMYQFSLEGLDEYFKQVINPFPLYELHRKMKFV